MSNLQDKPVLKDKHNIFFKKLMLVYLMPFLCGFDRKFPSVAWKTKWMNLFSRIYCIVIATIIIYIQIAFCPKYEYFLITLFVLLEYCLCVLIGVLSNNEIVYSFFKSISDVDIKLFVDVRCYEKRVLLSIIFPFLSITTRVFYSWTYCWYENDYCQKSWLWFSSYLFIAVAVDVHQFTLLIYFGALKYRMMRLSERLETKLSNAAFMLTNTKIKVIRHTNIIDYIKIYKKLLDAMDSMQLTINILLCVRLVCGVPSVLVWFYNVLKVMKTKNSIPYSIILVLEALHVSIIPCLPGIVAETIAADVEKIKLLLLEKFVDSKKKEEKRDIKVFLKYVEARPFKFCIWRTIAVDATLPIGLVSFYTTYIILIIQFTHWYE